MTDNETKWNISIKTVINTSVSSSSEFNAESNFNITIHPHDPIQNLYQQIENKTGLKADQQRLIYRGRLIPSQSQVTQNASSSTQQEHLRLVDISGLGDGHTIHLVPRFSSRSSNANIPQGSTAANNATASNAGESNLNSSLDGSSGFFTSAGPGLLAALLGIHPDGIQVETISSSDASGERGRVVRGIITPNTMNARRRNQNGHIQTAVDPLYPEPCPMENIRQSLLTMHTMMNGQEDQRSRNTTHPLRVNRKFYKGQWLDVKDTVHQWLEATVTDIVNPQTILRSDMDRHASLSQSRPNKSTVDASEDEAIGSNDFDGRLKLLLEPSPDPNDRILADLNNNDQLVGFREREGNDTVQLLKVHYNGWPNRWDEWIRSDSNRIRPFRTRSRHVKKSNQYCPSLEHTICEEINTHIRSTDDDIEGIALLPEVLRTMTNVQTLYAEALHERNISSTQELTINKLNRVQLYDLSLAYHRVLNSNKVEYVQQRDAICEIIVKSGQTCEDEQNIQVESLDDSTQLALYKLLISSNVKHDQESQSFPWIGRERISDLEDSDDIALEAHKQQAMQYKSLLDKKKLIDLAPLLDRLGRILIDAAPHVANIGASLSDAKIETISEEGNDSKPTAFENSSLMEDEEMNIVQEHAEAAARPLRPSWAMNAPTVEHTNDSQNNASILPDHVDFINGFVNHRNDNSSSRSRSSGNSGSSLLSSYLSNTISGNGRDRNMIHLGGGPGIFDVHIHAIVTGPGGIPINPIQNLFPTTNPAPSSNSPNGNTQEQVVVVPSEEANDLFADMYGTNNDPTNQVEIDDDDEEDEDYHPDSEDEEDESYNSDSDENHSSSELSDVPDLVSRRSISSSSSSMDCENEVDHEVCERSDSECNMSHDSEGNEDGNESCSTSDSLTALEHKRSISSSSSSMDYENEDDNEVCERSDDVFNRIHNSEGDEDGNESCSTSDSLPALEHGRSSSCDAEQGFKSIDGTLQDNRGSEYHDPICSIELDNGQDQDNSCIESEYVHHTAANMRASEPALMEPVIAIEQQDVWGNSSLDDNHMPSTESPPDRHEITEGNLNQNNNSSVRRWLQRIMRRE